MRHLCQRFKSLLCKATDWICLFFLDMEDVKSYLLCLGGNEVLYVDVWLKQPAAEEVFPGILLQRKSNEGARQDLFRT